MTKCLTDLQINNRFLSNSRTIFQQEHAAFKADPLGALKAHLEQMTAIRNAKKDS
jgi:hypothetical protein